MASITALVTSEGGSASRSASEVYVPSWFADIVAGKFQDPRAFLEGSAAWTAERVATLGQ